MTIPRSVRFPALLLGLWAAAGLLAAPQHEPVYAAMAAAPAEEEPAEQEPEKEKEKKLGMRSPAKDPEPAEQPPPPGADGGKLGMRTSPRETTPAGPYPLGDFLIQVAGALELPAPQEGFAHDSAAFALRGKGIAVRGEYTSAVTEEDVVGVLNGLGYRVRTTTPSRTVDAARAETLIAMFIPGPE